MSDAGGTSQEITIVCILPVISPTGTEHDFFFILNHFGIRLESVKSGDCVTEDDPSCTCGLVTSACLTPDTGLYRCPAKFWHHRYSGLRCKGDLGSTRPGRRRRRRSVINSFCPTFTPMPTEWTDECGSPTFRFYFGSLAGSLPTPSVYCKLMANSSCKWLPLACAVGNARRTGCLVVMALPWYKRHGEVGIWRWPNASECLSVLI